MNREDMKKRTKDFAIAILRFSVTLANTPESWAIRKQIVRSGTSPGANYRAACRGKSTADFINKLKIVEEELDETQYWLELIVAIEPEKRAAVKPLWKEADELLRITVSSLKKARTNRK